MLVSAVIIFLNAERFLEEAIESVRAQTYTDWELLLVDDGSTDGSSGCARRHAAAEPGRIRYLDHPGHVNLGMSAARNLGSESAYSSLKGRGHAHLVILVVHSHTQGPLIRPHSQFLILATIVMEVSSKPLGLGLTGHIIRFIAAAISDGGWRSPCT